MSGLHLQVLIASIEQGVSFKPGKISKGVRVKPPVILWFRRDLRLADHPALMAALESGAPIVPVYVHDDETPRSWKPGGASRWWLAQSLRSLDASLKTRGSRLILRKGAADTVLAGLSKEIGASAVHFTRGYEPFQRGCEERLKEQLGKLNVSCRRFGGHILFEPESLRNASGQPFRVYTSFAKAASAQGMPREPLRAPAGLPQPKCWPPSDKLDEYGFEPSKPDWASGLRSAWTCGEEAAHRRCAAFVDGLLPAYGKARDFPGTEGTSRLSPHLAFGEISSGQIWHAVHMAAEAQGNGALGMDYLREILWREFAYHLLFHYPFLPERPFRPEFEAFPWRKSPAQFHAWTKGLTGYPIVDAGMRQLWRIGWMHNRVRMITASFLIKHLRVRWQEGETWFWDTLADADLANNAVNWQWVAGSGAGAAPYFRIFNPVLQGEKFDPDGGFVRSFCPELGRLPNSVIHKPWEADTKTLRRAGVTVGETYPAPMVDHFEARRQALASYAAIKGT